MRSISRRLSVAPRHLALIPLVICGLLSIIASGGGGGGGVEVAPLPPPPPDTELTDLSISAGEFDQIFQSSLTDY